PELPLIEGVVDTFRQRGLKIFGPDSAGAALEGSKAFAKELMARAGIPTARHRTFLEAGPALAYLEEHSAPAVVKASGNAAGMGAYTPLPFVDAETEKRIYREITAATLQALQARGITFTGMLYTNVMLTADGPMVLEHNTRMGDPETQAMMLLMREDLVNVLQFAEILPAKR